MTALADSDFERIYRFEAVLDEVDKRLRIAMSEDPFNRKGLDLGEIREGFDIGIRMTREGFIEVELVHLRQFGIEGENSWGSALRNACDQEWAMTMVAMVEGGMTGERVK